jgi:arginase
MTVELIGVPTNSSGTTDGVARAPAALRAAGLGGPGALIDGGDIPVDPPSATRGPDGVIDGPNLARTLRRVRDRVAAARHAGRRPLLVGGDCPILLGAVAGCRDAGDEPFGLLFVDGHEDAWPAHASTTGEAADMELGWLLGRGLDELGDDLRAEVAPLDPTRIALIGPRDRAELDAAGVASVADVVPVLDAVTVGADPADVTAWALAGVRAGGHPWWLHVDLDVLSTSALPAVDYQQPGGLTWDELHEVIATALGVGGCVGASVTIYNPDLDPDRVHASVVAGVIAQLAGALASVG